MVALSVSAQESQLGRVEFPTSGSEKAQAHFLRGLAALHSFWYEEALEAFRESTKVEPDFAMGYWGEAMAHNHPLWSEQDIAAARQVLAKIKETPKLTERERAYIAAVRLLYGEGDKRARDAAYSAAMEKIYRAYPDDLDAAAFYSLSLLGRVRPVKTRVIACRRKPARSRSTSTRRTQIIRAPRITSFTRLTIRIMRFSRCPPRVVTRASLPKHITRVTCRRTFFCNSECGPKLRRRTSRRGNRLTRG